MLCNLQICSEIKSEKFLSEDSSVTQDILFISGFVNIRIISQLLDDYVYSEYWLVILKEKTNS